jgi:hypothetical protein
MQRIPSPRWLMLRDRYAPMNLFAHIPALGMETDMGGIGM